MATEVFDLEGKISVDYSDAQKGLNKISEAAEDVADNLDDVDDSADKAGESIEDSGDSADKADDSFSTWKVTLANLASQVITQLIDKCVELTESVIETGIETEYAFAQLETIAGTENIDALTESIMELSSETGIAADELAVTAYNAISAGASAEEAADMVEAACKLATAGFTDTDSALSVLSTAMNAYGDEAGTVTEISDSLIQVQNLGVTTIDELASSMGKAISTGSAYGVSLGNLESAYVSLTKAGISTEESTTYLSSMLSELGDSGSDVAAVLESETGKSFTELMNDGYSLGDVLGIIYESLGEDSTAMMNLWSSQEAGKASNAIINQGLEEFNENLETITSSTGSTEEAYSTMADTMSTKTDIMKTSFENLGLELYDELEPTIESIVDWITNSFIPSLETLIENMDIIIPIVASLAAGFVTLKTTMAITSLVESLNKGWQAYQLATEGATVAQYLLNAAQIANPMVLVIALIASLVAAIVVLWNTNDEFREAIISAWEAIKTAFSTALEAIQSVLQSAWDFISGIIDSIVEGFTSLWETVSGIFTTMAETFSQIWDTIVSVIQVAILLIVEIVTAAFDLITLPFQFIWENCSDTIISVWETISTTISNALSAIQSVITTVWNAVSSVFSTIWNAISSTFSSIWNSISSTVSSVINAISSTVSSVFNSIKSTISSILTSISSTFSSIWNSISSTVSTVINSIKSTISSGINSAYSTVSSVLGNISSKFSSIFKTVKSTVSGAIEKIKGYFNFSWSLPSLKLPHISITGSFSLNPVSVPHFSISWYKQAMEEGMIMDAPTIFGFDPESESFLGGGEAGSETVVGTGSLMDMVQAAVSEQNEGLLAGINSLIALVDEKLTMILENQGYDIVTDDGTILAYYTPLVDKELGVLAKKKGR